MQAFNSILALFFVAFAMTIALPLDVDWEFERMMNGTNGTWGNGTWDMRATIGNETWGNGTWGNGTWDMRATIGKDWGNEPDNGTWDMRATTGNETWGTYGTWGNGTWGTYGNETWGTYGNGTFGTY